MSRETHEEIETHALQRHLIYFSQLRISSNVALRDDVTNKNTLKEFISYAFISST